VDQNLKSSTRKKCNSTDSSFKVIVSRIGNYPCVFYLSLNNTFGKELHCRIEIAATTKIFNCENKFY